MIGKITNLYQPCFKAVYFNVDTSNLTVQEVQELEKQKKRLSYKWNDYVLSGPYNSTQADIYGDKYRKYIKIDTLDKTDKYYIKSEVKPILRK